MGSKALGVYYWVLVLGGVMIPGVIFLYFGYQAAGAVTPQNQIHVETAMIAFLTVDGLLLGLSPRFREAFGTDDKGELLANVFEAFPIAILTISLMWSLVAMLYAGFSTDVNLVSAWFKTSLATFFVAVGVYASFAILTRRSAKIGGPQVPRPD